MTCLIYSGKLSVQSTEKDFICSEKHYVWFTLKTLIYSLKRCVPQYIFRKVLLVIKIIMKTLRSAQLKHKSFVPEARQSWYFQKSFALNDMISFVSDSSLLLIPFRMIHLLRKFHMFRKTHPVFNLISVISYNFIYSKYSEINPPRKWLLICNLWSFS